MRYKKIMVLTIIFTCLLAVSAVSAAENATEDIIADVANGDVVSVENNNQVMEQTDNGETVSATDDGTFTALQNKINSAVAGSTITLENDYSYDEGFSTEGITIDRDLTINGNGHTLDGMSKARILKTVGQKTSTSTLVLNDIKFKNGDADYGGAIYSDEKMYSLGDYNYGFNYWHISINNCDFENNVAVSGGAIYGTYLKVTDSNFNSNSASSSGGAIMAHQYSEFTNCNFRNNNASYQGGAIDLNSPDSGRSHEFNNCIFENNYAKNSGGAIYCSEELIMNYCKFISNECGVSGGAVYTWGGGLYVNHTEFTKNHASYNGGALFYSNQVERSSGGSTSVVTFENSIENSIFTHNKADRKAGAIYGNQIYDNNQYFITIIKCSFENNVAAEENDVKGGNTYDCTFLLSTTIDASSITTVYNGDKYLVITLKDENGDSVRNAKLNVVLGTKTLNPTTDNNGQVKVSINGLLPVKTYDAKITFDGNSNYFKSAKTVQVTVKKATPKLTAKAKTFKKSVKTKNFVVTLKTNQNKVMKYTKVTLKVNGKTYSAKTNTKGQATFKITKLTKKGKFTATIKYAGSKYYNAKTVKAKITVK